MLPLRTAQTRSFRAFRSTISSEKYVLCAPSVYQWLYRVCSPHTRVYTRT